MRCTVTGSGSMGHARSSLALPVVGIVAWVIGVGCSKKSEQEPMTLTIPTPQLAPTATLPTASTPVIPGSAAAAAGMSGTLSVDPNPVALCDKTGLGSATVSWTANGAEAIEVRVAAPDGTLFGWQKGTKGQMKTGQWVTQGMTFYLQNATGSVPRNADHTLAVLTVDSVGGGPCP